MFLCSCVNSLYRLRFAFVNVIRISRVQNVKHHRHLIDDFRGACSVKGNVPVAGHVKRVDRGDIFPRVFV